MGIAGKVYTIRTELQGADVAARNADILDRSIVKLGGDIVKTGNSTNQAATQIKGYGAANQAVTAPLTQVNQAITQQTQLLPKTVQATTQYKDAIGGVGKGLTQVRGPQDLYTKNLTTTEKQTTTLTGKMKGFGSQFGVLSASMGTVASSTVNLVRGYQDLGDSQIAVEKAQKKVSTANEAVSKAQEKVNDLQRKGVTSGKDFEQAQLDLNQALQGQSIATQMLTERQEDHQRAQENFWMGVVPTITSTATTLLASLQAIGGTKGIGGVKGAITAIGPAIGGLIGNIRGLDGANKAAALSAKGLAAALGTIAVPLAGLYLLNEIIQINKTLEEELDKSSQSIISASKETDEGYTQFMKNMREETAATKEEIGKHPIFGPIQDMVQGIIDLVPGANESIKSVSDNMDAAAIKNAAAGSKIKGVSSEIISVWKEQIITARAQRKPIDDIVKAMSMYNLTGDEMNKIIQEADALWRRDIATGVEYAKTGEEIASKHEKMTATAKKLKTEEELLAEAGMENSGIWIDMGPAISGVDGAMLDLAKTKQKDIPITQQLNGAMLELYNQKKAKDAKALAEETARLAAEMGPLQEQTSAEVAEFTKLQDELKNFVDTSGMATDEMKAMVEVKQTITQITEDARTGYIKEEAALLRTASAHTEVTAQMQLMAKNTEDNTAQLAYLIAKSIDYTQALTDQEKKQKLMNQGFLDAAVKADDFYTSLVRNTEAERAYAMALSDGAKKMGVTADLYGFSISKIEEMNKAVYNLTNGYAAQNLEASKSTAFLKDEQLQLALATDARIKGQQAANDWILGLQQSTTAGKAEADQIKRIATVLLGEHHPALQKSSEDLKVFIEDMYDTEAAIQRTATALSDRLKVGFELISGTEKWSEAKKKVKEFLDSIKLPKDLEKKFMIKMHTEFKAKEVIDKANRELSALTIIAPMGIDEKKFDEGIDAVLGHLQSALAKGADVQPMMDLLEKIKASGGSADLLVKSLSGLTGLSAEQILTDTEALNTAIAAADPVKVQQIADAIAATGTGAGATEEPLNTFQQQIVDIQDVNKVMNTHYIEGLNAMGNKTEEFRNFAGSRMSAVKKQVVSDLTEMNKKMNTHYIAGLNASGNKTAEFNKFASGNMESAKKNIVADIVEINKKLNTHFIAGMNASGNKTTEFKNLAVKNLNAVKTSADGLTKAIDSLAKAMDKLDGKKATITIEQKTIKTTGTARYGGSFVTNGYQMGGAFISHQDQFFRDVRISEFNKPELVTVTPLSNPMDINDKEITVRTNQREVSFDQIANKITKGMENQIMRGFLNTNLFVNGQQVYNAMRPFQLKRLSTQL